MSKELANEPKQTIKRRWSPDKGLEKQRPAGPEAGAANILRLQRQVGNRAVQRLLAPRDTAGLTQRQGGGEGFDLDDETAGRINSARGGGQSLDSGLQEAMGAQMGYDFSGVRVHTGPESDELNQQLSARAFTTGQDIFFRQGEYNPGSSDGRELVAHELSHVVQQGTGRVPGSGSGMTVRPAGDAFEQEADSLARQAASGGTTSASAAEASGGEGVQRHGDEEIQEKAVQRQGEDEEEEPVNM